MLSSLRLAIARPAFLATRAFSATPRVADDLFMRGIPFAWERRDVEEFVKDSGIQAEKVSLPPSDRRPTGNRGYAFITVAPEHAEEVIQMNLEYEGRQIEIKR